jgi:hypothetical protein
MTPAQVRFLLEEALVRDGATPRDIAADAVAKDEALDAYELALAARVASAEREGEAEAEALAQKILDLQARRREALDQIAERRTRLAAWRARKADAEREWADVLEVLAPFLTVADG